MKEEVNFVALKDEAIIVKFGCLENKSRILNLMPWLFDNCLFSMMPFVKDKVIDSYEFNISPFWLRIYNIPLEYMDRQTALDVGKAIDKCGGSSQKWTRSAIVFFVLNTFLMVFSWRVGHEILPTNSKIASIRPTMNLDCQRCGAERETLIHAIKDYPTARETLVCGGLDDRLVRNEFDRCIGWLEAAMRILDKSHGGLHYSCLELVEQQKQFYFPRWKKPAQGVIKINVDAAIDEERMGLGVIVRDKDGFVLGGYGSIKDTTFNSDWPKIMAIEEGVILAKNMNLERVKILCLLGSVQRMFSDNCRILRQR
ncbi:hypothetical protein PVK06_009020 [Gossypium arboreum]|uniref:DUF4283 domain-containing protein n=1 Tax=Gossypium arboreum TaxID=29729 RepID=A0ABR0QLT7_GOSAR|nr:hypothetical protein PVK06_009020 [Gossypium arboreum]